MPKRAHEDENQSPHQTPTRKNRRQRLDWVEIRTPKSSEKPKATSSSSSPSPTTRRKRVPADYNDSLMKDEYHISPQQPQHLIMTPESIARDQMVKPSQEAVIFPEVLPETYYPYFAAQKRATLAALTDPSTAHTSDDGPEEGGPEINGFQSQNAIAFKQLLDLLEGTTKRGEGNSCLILGPRSSGKSKLVDKVLSSLEPQPIVIRLNGLVQHNDRLAMQEIARQVSMQHSVAQYVFAGIQDEDEDANPFLEQSTSTEWVSLPPSAHLPTLVAALAALPRPVIVILDAFDLFTTHARQALLYCLLDTVQSCRSASSGGNSSGLAVVGVTSRVDILNLFEKRVKSRFSHRIIRTSTPSSLDAWIRLSKNCLCAKILPIDLRSQDPQDPDYGETLNQWVTWWSFSIERLLEEKVVKQVLKDMFGLTKDSRLLSHVLASMGSTMKLTTSKPFLSASNIQMEYARQSVYPRFPLIKSLPYPSLCLLIAAHHVHVSGHDTFTFEMLFEKFREQLRTSHAAPMEKIKMLPVSKSIMLGNFENLIRTKAFKIANSLAFTKTFVKYHCVVPREELKLAINRRADLTKWLNRATQ